MMRLEFTDSVVILTIPFYRRPHNHSVVINCPILQTTPQPQRKNRFSTQESSSTSDSDNISESDQVRLPFNEVLGRGRGGE